MANEITYNDAVIATPEGGQSVTLPCAGKKMLTDLNIKFDVSSNDLVVTLSDKVEVESNNAEITLADYTTDYSYSEIIEHINNGGNAYVKLVGDSGNSWICPYSHVEFNRAIFEKSQMFYFSDGTTTYKRIYFHSVAISDEKAARVSTTLLTSDWVEGAEGIPAGGTTGQILSKKSEDDGDVEWVDPPTSGVTEERVIELINGSIGNLPKAEEQMG